MLIQEQTVGDYRTGPGGVGFVTGLKLLRTTHVLAVLDPTQLTWPGLAKHTISKAGIVVTEGAVATEVKFPPRQCTWTETPDTGRDGGAFIQVIEAGLVRPNGALMAWLSANRDGRWVAIWRESGGQVYMAGEPGNGLRLTFGRSLTDTSRLQLTLTGRTGQPAYFLESYANADLFPDAEYDQSFDLSFTS